MDPGLADPVADQLHRLCARAMTTLPATGAGLSVLSADRQYSLLASADPVSEQLEELQFVLGEGPCVDAAAGRRPVLIPHLADAGPARWPGYTPAASELGVQAVFAFPLQVGAAQLGVLDVYRNDPGNLTGDQLRYALALVDEAIAILLDAQERRAGSAQRPDALGSTLDADADQPAAMLPGPVELFQAQGMVMAQIGGTLTEAMARIRAYAYAKDRRLIDVARDIVARKVRFGRDV
jgi:GAF domain-containing protein